MGGVEGVLGGACLSINEASKEGFQGRYWGRGAGLDHSRQHGSLFSPFY